MKYLFSFSSLIGKKTVVWLTIFSLLGWSLGLPQGLDYKSAKAATLTSVVVQPQTAGADNLVGHRNATWDIAVNNITALTASTTAVEITFPQINGGYWDVMGATITATSNDPTLQFDTAHPKYSPSGSAPDLKVLLMANANQDSADNNFQIHITGVINPKGTIEVVSVPQTWQVRTCLLNESGNVESGCGADVDSTATAQTQFARRGGTISDYLFTASNYAASAAGVEYTVQFTASTTLNVGEKISVAFPSSFILSTATTSTSTINGGSAYIGAMATSTSDGGNLNRAILTVAGEAIVTSSAITVRIGNITNPTKGSHSFTKVFTTTSDDGLVDGTFFGYENPGGFSPPPPEAIQIGGTNKIAGIVKVQTPTTTRVVTSAEAAQIKVQMGCPDKMFFVGNKDVGSDGTFVYDHLLDASYVAGLMPLNPNDESFFMQYLQPNMMQINVVGDDTATLTPTFVMPDGVLLGQVSGGLAGASGVFIRAYSGDIQTFAPIFTNQTYSTQGLNGVGAGYFRIPIKSGKDWFLDFQLNDGVLTDGSVKYWPPAISDPVYIPSGTATTTLSSAYSFVVANKILRVTVYDGDGNLVRDGQDGPRPCLSIKRTGSDMMSPKGQEVCTTNGGDYYQMNIPVGAFDIEVMMAGSSKTYPVVVASEDSIVTKTIKIEKPTNYISGTVVDGDSFPIQGVSVMAQGSNGTFRQSLTNSSGQFTLYVNPGTYRVEAFAPGFGPLPALTGIEVTEGLNATGTDFTINSAGFKAIRGRVYTDANSNNQYDIGETTYSNVHVHAFGSFGGNNAVTREDGTYILRVPAGTGYQVEAWSDSVGFGGRITNLNVSDDVLDKNFKIAAQGTLEITVTNGNTYGLTEIFAGAFNPSTGKGNGSNSWIATSSDQDLITSFSLPAGSYRVDVGTPSFGNLMDLPANGSASSTTITAGNTSSITLSLPSMVTITGSTTVAASVWVSRMDGPGKFSVIADSSGSYSMKVPSGYTYKLGASLTGYINTPINITPTENMSRDLTMTAAGSTISGTVSGSSALSEGFVWAVKSGNGGWTGTEIGSDGTYSLSVDDGTWRVYAEAPCYNQSSGVNQVGSGTVNIALTEISGCTFEVPDVHSVVPTAGGAISQSDVSVNIPANALGTGSSNVSFSISKPSTVPPSTLNATPIASSTKRILVSDSDGTSITSLSNSIEISITYSEDDLPEGTSESDLQLGYWNSANSSWETIAATIDTDNNTITGMTSHLTDFAPIVSIGSTPPSTPTGLAASAGSSSINLSWNANSESDFSYYNIYRDTSADGSFALFATASSGIESYSDANVSLGITYYYKISAVDADANESAASAAVHSVIYQAPSGGTYNPYVCNTCDENNEEELVSEEDEIDEVEGEEVSEEQDEVIISTQFGNGDLVREAGDQKVYLIKNGRKIWITDAEVFNKAGFNWGNIKEIGIGAVKDTASVVLVRAVGNDNVYIIEGDRKRHIPNPETFRAYGYNWSDIIEINPVVLAGYHHMKLIRITGASEVYRLENGKVLHITNPNIFQKAGYAWDQIKDVAKEEMNAYIVSKVIRVAGDTKVYLVENGLKRWVRNERVFKRLRLEWRDIMDLDSEEIGAYESGQAIDK